MTKISKDSFKKEFKKINIDTIINFQQINKFSFRSSRSYLQDKNIVAKILLYAQFWYRKILNKIVTIETMHKMHITWQIRDHHMLEICVNRISQISPINLHSIKLFMARKNNISNSLNACNSKQLVSDFNIAKNDHSIPPWNGIK